ncbi:MAG: hypothetical protein HS111_10855 [Kofleriaceae bacterium]|nr:hypothetical protein [Kofleriaceae bacterium]
MRPIGGMIALSFVWVGVVGAGDARGADYLTLLDWACDPRPANTAAVKAMALSACEATEGARAACAVVSGTPFGCFTHEAVARDNRSCDKGAVRFTISGATGATLGWKVEGTLTVSAEYALYWSTAQECALTARTPVPSSAGGAYIFKAGSVKAVAIMTASGEGRVTFLGGTVFSERINKQCVRDLTITAYRQATASGCQGPPATPPATPSATATPSASASPTPPQPSPTATAWPTPTATAVL